MDSDFCPVSNFLLESFCNKISKATVSYSIVPKITFESPKKSEFGNYGSFA